jgi:hypothetical protein
MKPNNISTNLRRFPHRAIHSRPTSIKQYSLHRLARQQIVELCISCIHKSGLQGSILDGILITVDCNMRLSKRKRQD